MITHWRHDLQALQTRSGILGNAPPARL